MRLPADTLVMAEARFIGYLIGIAAACFLIVWLSPRR
jgi:hypothetical protein